MDAKTPPTGVTGLKIGAGEIAEHVLGEDTDSNRRKVYHLHEIGVLPTFMWGSQLALNPERLSEHLSVLEAEGREEQLRKRELRRAEAEDELRWAVRRRQRQSRNSKKV
jgi:hypothetical protein